MAFIYKRPELTIRAYTRAAIPQRVQDAFLIRDVFSDQVKSGWGDVIDAVREINPTLSNDWNAQPQFVSIDPSLDFVRFLPNNIAQFGVSTPPPENGTDKAGDDLSGFILKARTAFLDCKIKNSAGQDSPLDGGNFDINFEASAGQFETVLPPQTPRRTCIRNVGSAEVQYAYTKGKLPKNRSLRYDLSFQAQKSGGAHPACTVGIGDESYALMFMHDQALCLLKATVGTASGYAVLKRFDEIKCNLKGGKYVAELRRIAGRLVVRVATGGTTHSYHIVEAERVPGNQKARAVESGWASGGVMFFCQNVRATLGLALIKYANAADTPYSGALVRRQARRVFLNPATTVEGHATGWALGGTQATMNAVVNPTDVTYTATLTASAEGIDTPFVNKCCAEYPGHWDTPSAPSIELRPVAQKLRISSGHPSLAPAATGSMEIDRLALTNYKSNWENYVSDYNPIEIQMRWQGENNGQIAYTGWHKLMRAYIYRVAKSTSSALAQRLQINFLDPLVRLQDLNCKIDHRYPPLDFVFLSRVLQSADPLRFAIYGGDCIREILRLCLGDEEAARLNGGLGDNHFLPPGAPPMMAAGDNQFGYLQIPGIAPPTNNGWWFPAPHGEDGIAWLQKIARMEKALFWYGWPTGMYLSEWPSPVYAREPQWLQTRNLYELPDAVYSPGDQNRALYAAETTSRPEKDYNRVLTWANMPGGAMNGLMPALRMAEARMAGEINGDMVPSAAEYSWERTLVVKEDALFYPGAAEAVAQTIINDLTGINRQWPRLTFRGIPTLQWGDLIRPKMVNACASDATLGLSGKTYRLETFEHNFDLRGFGRESYTTSAHLRPRSRGAF